MRSLKSRPPSSLSQVIVTPAARRESREVWCRDHMVTPGEGASFKAPHGGGTCGGVRARVGGGGEKRPFTAAATA